MFLSHGSARIILAHNTSLKPTSAPTTSSTLKIKLLYDHIPMNLGRAGHADILGKFVEREVFQLVVHGGGEVFPTLENAYGIGAAIAKFAIRAHVDVIELSDGKDTEAFLDIEADIIRHECDFWHCASAIVRDLGSYGLDSVI